MLLSPRTGIRSRPGVAVFQEAKSENDRRLRGVEVAVPVGDPQVVEFSLEPSTTACLIGQV